MPVGRSVVHKCKKCGQLVDPQKTNCKFIAGQAYHKICPPKSKPKGSIYNG